jgi:cytochrome c biogenesis protein CcmG/thiol:disulfide interchange protein DsbE
MFKKIVLGVVITCLLAVGGIFYLGMDGARPGKASAQENGQLAPDITVQQLDGTEVKLSDLRGKPVFLNFWATWCPPCVGEMPHFEALYPKYQNQIQFLAVSQDAKKEAADSFIADKGYTFPVAWDADQKAGQTYGVQAIPTSVLIDAEGKIIDIHVGGMSAGQLEDFLKQAVK